MSADGMKRLAELLPVAEESYEAARLAAGLSWPAWADLTSEERGRWLQKVRRMGAA